MHSDHRNETEQDAQTRINFDLLGIAASRHSWQVASIRTCLRRRKSDLLRPASPPSARRWNTTSYIVGV